jgi:predicted nucleotidyltransferase
MFDWSMYRGNLAWLPTRTIYITRHGSHAYGLNTPESDLDLRGIAIPPKEYFIGFLKRFEQAESKDPDLTIHDIRKFFVLAAECNPNIIEVLWSDEEDHLLITPVGKKLLDARALFLSRKAKSTFSGYAIAQLKRIKTHRKWLLNPPTHKPTREEFQLPETSLLPADILGAMQSNMEQDPAREKDYPAYIMTLYHQERAYQNALREWQQHETWKAQRNPKRAALEAKYGYDSKHASHLVRLMRMCREILTTGQVIVKRRADRDELLAIKQGAWKYEDLIVWAEQQDSELAALEKSSLLPHGPDRDRLDQLCIEIVEVSL